MSHLPPPFFALRTACLRAPPIITPNSSFTAMCQYISPNERLTPLFYLSFHFDTRSFGLTHQCLTFSVFLRSANSTSPRAANHHTGRRSESKASPIKTPHFFISRLFLKRNVWQNLLSLAATNICCIGQNPIVFCFICITRNVFQKSTDFFILRFDPSSIRIHFV